MRKYLLEFTLRHDGSFNFPEDKRFGTFPGISVGWTISEEPFMSGLSGWLDNFKIRASYALMGNDRIESFQYLMKYAFGTGIENGYAIIFGKTPAFYQGMYIENTPNPNITWETAKMQNVGFDALLWKGKLSLNFDYFYEKRGKILITRSESVPAYTGLELSDENLGKVDNSGIELNINHLNQVGNFHYNIGGNFTYNHNKIVYMDEPQEVYEYQEKEGHPMNSFLVYVTDGIFNSEEEIANTEAKLDGTQPGDLKYVDINGDGAITDADKIRKYTSPIPEIQFGLNFGLQFKGIELNAWFMGQTNAENLVWFPSEGNRPEYLFTKRWTPENPDAEFPRATGSNDFYNRESTFWLYDASYVGLKNLELAYNLTSINWFSNYFKSFRIYVRGSNLWNIDHLRKFGVHPETPENQQPTDYYPQLTTILTGLDIRF
jgi:TonB-linked SusC/RagA family outer membrane protein